MKKEKLTTSTPFTPEWRIAVNLKQNEDCDYKAAACVTYERIHEPDAEDLITFVRMASASFPTLTITSVTVSPL